MPLLSFHETVFSPYDDTFCTQRRKKRISFFSPIGRAAAAAAAVMKKERKSLLLHPRVKFWKEVHRLPTFFPFSLEGKKDEEWKAIFALYSDEIKEEESWRKPLTRRNRARRLLFVKARRRCDEQIEKKYSLSLLK